jgi:hypothetical protein
LIRRPGVRLPEAFASPTFPVAGRPAKNSDIVTGEATGADRQVGKANPQPSADPVA